MTVPLVIAWNLLFSSLCSFPGAFRQGELLPDQPSPQEHSPAHTKGLHGTRSDTNSWKRAEKPHFFSLFPLGWCPPVSAQLSSTPSILQVSGCAIPGFGGCRSTDPPS